MEKERAVLKEHALFEVARAMAQLGTCKRSKVGAVIVRNGRIISTGYNGSPPGQDHCLDVGCLMENGHCIRCTHAEMNALMFAARYGISTEGASILVYGWTTGNGLGICPTCDKASKSAGITQTIIVPMTMTKLS